MSSWKLWEQLGAGEDEKLDIGEQLAAEDKHL
jgi:hypothetical protein